MAGGDPGCSRTPDALRLADGRTPEQVGNWTLYSARHHSGPLVQSKETTVPDQTGASGSRRLAVGWAALGAVYVGWAIFLAVVLW